ncbi:MAG: hypothetical protein JWO82_455 [Akkermansiaceae bacterium]|nr:hypothetical protein [Akkermansiaceae bacterium]
MSKLLTIHGIGPDELELLDAAGWGDVRAVAGADPGKLTAELAKANSMLKIVTQAPDEDTVALWVKDAQDLHENGEVSKRPKPVARRVSAPAERSAAVRSPGQRKPAATAAVEETPAAAVATEPVFDEEAALAEVSGPVNFEADPEVMKMLLQAPVAIPIPGRVLADKGIKPSEIAVAPLLNRALGDLDVRVAEPAVVPVVEETNGKKKFDLPTSSVSESRSRSSSAGPGQTTENGLNGRRGIDVGRVRTIEEFQGDTPPPRNSSSRAGMEDDRIALLRAPRPGTNGRRKPSSRFYIRGVLHDRPLKVWFGGLFAVLLQIMLPLALIAAPLLILADQQVRHFEWVPAWIIAFPIALPVLAVLYAMVSTGAKCRVCGQRLYVPKNCLKNRKAHKAFYFGHIGALAMHVMIFKWFNCTFCGTPIRIKK